MVTFINLSQYYFTSIRKLVKYSRPTQYFIAVMKKRALR